MVTHIGGLADNGTVLPVGLPWITPQIKCSFGGDIIVHPYAATVSLEISYETTQIDCGLTLMHLQGYRANINMGEDDTTRVVSDSVKIHLQGYKATVI